MDRRTSRDEQQRVRRTQSDNANVFDDEYAADLSDGDDFVGVSDGFRPQPAQPRLSMQRDARDSQSLPRRVPGASKPSESQPSRHLPRSSIAKGHAAQASLTIAHDGSNDPFADPPSSSTAAQRPHNAAQALMHRASVASTSSFATSGARTLSLAGPSHPYAMYPQGTGVARTSSTTTSSTQPPPRRSVSLERPQHPYGMYPQSPIDPEHDEPSTRVPAIPVGFPGLSSSYHRQIGPDGEEQDIIGPDGHTEQLPPYSRYPEEGPTKESFAATTATSAVPVPPPGASNASQSNNAPTADAVSSDMSISQVERTGTQETQQTEKNWREKSWSEKKKTRIFCGRVPLWLVLVLISLVMVFAVILGTAIGTMLAKAKHNNNNNNNNNNKHDNSPQAALASQTFSDASPIPSPTGIIPVATGFFQLSLDTPEETQRNCITDPSESAAWSCQISSSPAFFNLTQIPNGAYTLNVGTPGGNTDYVYGVQVPSLPPQDLDFVVDQDEPNRGPALHFQTLYNKLVVLPVSGFSSKARRGHNHNNNNNNNDNQQKQTDDDNGDSNNNNNNNDNNNNHNNNNGNNTDNNDMSSSRNGFKMPGGFKHRFEVQQGDVAWFCFWNATFIEGFFYVDQNSSFATQTGSPFPSQTQSSQNGNQGSSAAPPPTGAPSTPQSTAPGSTAAPQSTPPPSRRDTLVQLVERGGGPQIPNYPRAIKVVERRIPPVPQAVCQQMRMDALGPNPVLDSNNQPIVKNLSVTDPSLNDFLKGTNNNNNNHRLRRSTLDDLKKRDDPSSACLCQWISQ